jgi:hypothetical protein
MTTKRFCDFHGCKKDVTEHAIGVKVEELLGISEAVITHGGVPTRLHFCDEHWQSILSFIGEKCP